MNAMVPTAPDKVIEYPDRDGKPMADNTKQARWMALLYGNLCALFRTVADVFVAMDLLWYAQEGKPGVRNAPDVLVVFGRPKGDRGSYKQWEENDMPVTVVFEILSPGNTVPEMIEKFAFYEDHGVEEYYIYDPESHLFQVNRRREDVLTRVRQADGFVSPRLGIRFDLSGPELVIYHPNGRRFLTFEELEAELQGRRDAEQRLELVQRRSGRQAELMRKVLQQQATSDELQELQRLLEQQPPAS